VTTTLSRYARELENRTLHAATTMLLAGESEAVVSEYINVQLAEAVHARELDDLATRRVAQHAAVAAAASARITHGRTA
jgi:hypothetical protein